MNVYLIIFEDGSPKRIIGDLPEEILPAADDGLLQVFDITEPLALMEYYDEGWTNMNFVD